LITPGSSSGRRRRREDMEEEEEGEEEEEAFKRLPRSLSVLHSSCPLAAIYNFAHLTTCPSSPPSSLTQLLHIS